MAKSHRRDPTKLAARDFHFGAWFGRIMDRTRSAAAALRTTTADVPAQDAACGPVVVSVCTTCRSSDTADAPRIGQRLLDAVKSTMAAIDAGVLVRPVQCLGVCTRPATIAVSSPGGYTFLFGDLPIDGGDAALAAFVQRYRTAPYGLVPWRERAEVLRRGMVARVPPASWSPDDGRPPP